MSLTAVVIEKHTRRAVQLRYHYPLGTIDDKGATIGHERNFAHVDFLLLDILDGLGGGLLIVEYQPDLDTQ